MPNAGKSTVAKALGFPQFEADQFFTDAQGNYNWDAKKAWIAHKSCQERLEKAMVAGEPNLVVSNTSTTDKEVNTYIDIAKKHGYQYFVLVVERRHDNKNNHNVPDEKIIEMAERLQKSIKLI